MAARIFERVTFTGSKGDELAARLDLPAGPAKATAIFAHCFTCSKDVVAASRVSEHLTREGIAVLRFDFTGLGSSGGDFGNTNFSSNVEDLELAAKWLTENRSAPQILVGHSLGGAAVAMAAANIPSVKAVATIGAPSEVEHVAMIFDSSVETIAEHGEALVKLAGREFCIQQQFLDDLRDVALADVVGEWKGAWMFLHSPIDNTVGIDHAAALYAAAKHPKTFVSLDDADHLLTRPLDAEYAASMIATWAMRHIDDERGLTAAPDATAPVVVQEAGQGKFLQHVVAGEHRFLADEPLSVGGFDAGPTPYDLLGAALGTCTSMTMRMYGERKGFDFDTVTVEVSHDRIHADDCESCADDRTGQVDVFTRRISIDAPNLSAEDRARLIAIADRCPVHRTMEASSVIETIDVDS